MKKAKTIFQPNHDQFQKQLHSNQISLKEKIADLEKIVSHCDLNNSQKPRFKHHASVNDYSQRLSRSQISLIRAQNRKNFVNFILALLCFSVISFFIIIAL